MALNVMRIDTPSSLEEIICYMTSLSLGPFNDRLTEHNTDPQKSKG